MLRHKVVVVDMAALKRLAAEGIQEHGERLGDISAFCDDWGRETGDARYLLLGDLFRTIDDWWEEQGVGQPLLDSIDQEIRGLLPAALAEPDPADGSRLVAVLSERVHLYLVPTHVWAKENRGED